VTFHDLYEEYPGFDIDIQREQQLLVEHDLFILQHPFFWYSVPPLVKQWFDLVLEHGWAYGSRGTALKRKRMLSLITTGGREEAYQEGGYNRYTIRQLLSPLEQTARLCGIDYLPPYVIHGTHRMTIAEIEAETERYEAALWYLNNADDDLTGLRDLEYANQYLIDRATRGEANDR
jgi:glutathione-regulated potassium-efflux system ancillary protein KefG